MVYDYDKKKKHIRSKNDWEEIITCFNDHGEGFNRNGDAEVTMIRSNGECAGGVDGGYWHGCGDSEGDDAVCHCIEPGSFHSCRGGGM